MVIRHGRVTDINQPDLATLLRDLVQQQTTMLQVQAESVRLQRVLVDRRLRQANHHRVSRSSDKRLLPLRRKRWGAAGSD